MLTPYQYVKKNLGGRSDIYVMFVVKTYVSVLKVILFRALGKLIKGTWYAIRGQEEKKAKEFLEGSRMWGEEVVKITGTSLYISNEIKTPERGHMVLINHVNELDFPFDSLVIKLPYLANQQIKSAYLAYWWMKAMGSQVFDSSKSITIATSVRNLINGLKWASFIVYPEGHNSYSEDIKPLKKGMIKLAHERNIPVFVVLKAGLTRFETLKSGNVVGFKSAGVVYPSNFTDWEEFRDYIFDLMVKTKSELDQEIKEKFSLPGV